MIYTAYGRILTPSFVIEVDAPRILVAPGSNGGTDLVTPEKEKVPQKKTA